MAGEPCHADKKLSMVNEGGGVACGRSVGIMTRVVAAMVGIGSRGRGACEAQVDQFRFAWVGVPSIIGDRRAMLCYVILCFARRR